MLDYHVCLMASTHRGDIHPSGGAGPLLSLCSRPLAGVSAVCPALLALVRAHQWPIKLVESAAEAVSELLHTLDRLSRGKIPPIQTPVAAFF